MWFKGKKGGDLSSYTIMTNPENLISCSTYVYTVGKSHNSLMDSILK